jgi:hypothetical protein
VAEPAGVEGDPGDNPETTGAETRGAEADPAAIALALDRAKRDSELSRSASDYLKRQRRLVDLQIDCFDDERRYANAAAKRKRYAEWIRNINATCITVFLTGLLALVSWTVWDAARDHSLVLDAFSVPPDQAQHGLTGQVIAKQALDRLSDMQPNTWSARPANSYSNNWGEDLRVEIPSTGVTFGELRRFLREALGHEIHISGELTDSAAGITLTIRAGEKGKSFPAEEKDLERLVQQAAEFAYVQTQPYLYARYLFDHGRRAEALPILVRLEHDPNPLERAWAHVSMGMDAAENESDLVKYAAEQRAALREVPALAQAVNNLIRAEISLGHDAAVFDLADQCLADEWEMKASVAPQWQEQAIANCLVYRSMMQGDYADVVRNASITPPNQIYASFAPGWLAFGQLFSHDLDGALANSQDFPVNLRDMVEAYVALERGDARAEQLWTAVSKEDDDLSKPGARDTMLRFSGAYLALAKARLGDLPGAQEQIALTPADCYRCVRFRGQIAALAGDAVSA